MSKKVLLILSVVAIFTLVLPLTACAPKPAPTKIAYLAQSAFANDFTLVEYYGVVDSIKAAGYEPVIYNPDFDGAKQISMMEDAIAAGGLAGIIVHPIDCECNKESQ
jgi:ABC-type sugar transport system substrate-binding protein